MDQLAKQAELDRLYRTLAEIQAQLTAGADSFLESKAELRSALTSYWENNRSDIRDEAQLVETVARQRSLTAASHRRQLQLRRMINSPYFGRIDFAEKRPDGRLSDSEPVYIGISTLTDLCSGSILVYDWRSPISGMFYDFERGEAFYKSPIGIINGKITLKRQYKIRDGRMIYLFDSDLKIDDEILQEILGHSADEKMRTIVTSIQREQNQVIRNDQHRFLFVQGPAGSGKTSIALHRAAYLLYRERETITAKNILIFSPNQIFSDYISNVLPEMGEENILQTTFNDYAVNSGHNFPGEIEDWNSQIESLLNMEDEAALSTRIASIRFKSAPAFAAIIENYCRFLEEQFIREYPAIAFRGQVIFAKEEWGKLFTVDLAYLPIAKRLSQIRQFIEVRLRPITEELRKEKEAEIAATGEEVNEKTIKALARMAAREALNPVIQRVAQLTAINSFQLYRQLFESKTLLKQLAKEDRLPQEWPVIRSQTLAFFNNGFIPYEDSIPLLYFQGFIEGFPTRGDIKYLLIDEAQDYTEIQYSLLKSLFPKCTWTILGDPCQSIHPYLETADFARAAEILNDHYGNLKEAQLITLSRSYRSTREIQAFCREILAGSGNTELISRTGQLPQILRFTGSALYLDALVSTVKQLQSEGLNSIALICKTAVKAKEFYENLHRKMEITLVSRDDIEFRRGVVVIPSYLAKGLEFDGVIVIDADAQNYHRESERKLFYTVCARALHRLILFYQGDLTPFVKNIGTELYNTVRS